MKPYMTYVSKEHGKCSINIIMLDDVKSISTESQSMIVVTHDKSIVVGKSNYPIFGSVLEEISEWERKMTSKKGRQYAFDITQCIYKHEKDYIDTLLKLI